MPLIEGDFTQVPDSIPPINLGVYTWEIKRAEMKPNKDGDAMNLEVDYEIVDEVPDKGRQQTMYYSLKKRPKDLHLVNIRRNLLSAGMPIPPGGFDTDLLIGQRVRGQVDQNNYTNQSGQLVESTRLNKILIPGDTGYAP